MTAQELEDTAREDFLADRYEQALSGALRALAMQPDRWPAALLAARAYTSLERSEEALPLIDSVIAQHGPAEAYHEKAAALLELKRPGEAREYAHRAIELAKTAFFDARLELLIGFSTLAEVYLALGDEERAKAALGESRRIGAGEFLVGAPCAGPSLGAGAAARTAKP
jgi:tetratricopeptide (TPR) repeat protein